jgi:hypothetical protein
MREETAIYGVERVLNGRVAVSRRSWGALQPAVRISRLSVPTEGAFGIVADDRGLSVLSRCVDAVDLREAWR